MTIGSDTRRRWFLTGGDSLTRGDSQGQLPRVFCFPHAGGNARAFLDWQPALAADAEVMAVCMPGRAHRCDEPPPTSIDELADGAARAIAAQADRPVLLFGHSLGALVAFEVARRLRDEPALRHLVVSGCSAPELLPTERVRRIAQLDGREFAEAVAFFGGLPPEIIAEEDLLYLLLPNLIADFRLVARYRYRPAPPLAVGASVIAGVDDPHVDEAALALWRHEFATVPARHPVDGGHFYFDQQPDAVLDVLRPLVRAAAVPEGDHIELI
jgi:surfactin synthase thioesterase subunit